LLSSLVCALSATSTFAWQNSGDQDQDQSEQQENADNQQNQAEHTEKNESVKGPRSLYFLGSRPQPLRQQGPAIGKPISILPHPYVPKGSILVPPAPMGDIQASDNALLEQGATGEIDENAASLQPQGQDGSSELALARLQGQLANNLGAVSAADEPSAEAVQSSEGAVLEGAALAQLDPSGVAVAGQAARYADGFWQGYSRAQIALRFAEYAETSGSPALTYIANKIVLSGAVLDAPVDDADIIAFVEARLALLMQLGNVDGYVGLLATLPGSHDWSPLARHFANSYLLQGKIGDTCSLAAEERENNDDAYWLALVAFCEATRGNRAGVDFQLGILEEVSDVQPIYYQLIDQILVEAEQPPGAVLPATVTLPSSLRIGLLEATMARLARVNVPELALEDVNPLAVGMMLALPGVSADARTSLMGMALQSGWADGQLMASFARSIIVTDEEREAALQMQTQDDRFTIDAVLASVASQPADGAAREAALNMAWDRALRQNYAAVAGEGLIALVGDLHPNAQVGGGVLARAALISGDTALAQRWFTALRSQSEGANADADKALLSLAPMMALAGTDYAPTLSPALLQRWWLAQAERPDRFERANLLFTVLEALGDTIGDQAWVWLEAGPAAFGGAVPAPAQWRRFLIAAQNGDRPQALAFAFKLLSDGGISGVSASLAGSLVGTLREMGLENEARMIATEILISQGL